MAAPVAASVVAPVIIGNARLYLQDCREGLRQLRPGSVDVVVTSPPYNIGTKYETYDDSGPEAEFIEWLGGILNDLQEVLHPQGSIFLNLGGRPSDAMKPLRVFFGANAPQHFYRLKGRPFAVQNVIHWIKAISLAEEPVQGHFNPCNSDRFLTQHHEYLFHLTHDSQVSLDKLAVGVPFKDKSNLKRGNRGVNGDVRDRGNVWFIPYPTIQKRDRDRPHPASFPTALVERCLRLHGLARISTVVDPFMGIGTVGSVCQVLQLGFQGYELDPLYFQTAVESLKAGLPPV